MSWFKQLDYSSIQEQASGLISNLELLNLDQMAENQEKEQELKELVDQINEDVINTYEDILEFNSSKEEIKNDSSLEEKEEFYNNSHINNNKNIQVKEQENNIQNFKSLGQSDKKEKDNNKEFNEISSPIFSPLPELVVPLSPVNSSLNSSEFASVPPPSSSLSTSLSVSAPVLSPQKSKNTLQIKKSKKKTESSSDAKSSLTISSYFSRPLDPSNSLNIYRDDDEETQLTVLSVLPKERRELDEYSKEKLLVRNDLSKNEFFYKYSSTESPFQFNNTTCTTNNESLSQFNNRKNISFYQELVIYSFKEIQESFSSFLETVNDLKRDSTVSSDSPIFSSPLFMFFVKFIGILICSVLFLIHFLYIIICKPILVFASLSFQFLCKYRESERGREGFIYLCCGKMKDIIEGSGSGSLIRDLSSAENNKFIFIVIISLFILSIWHFENYINHST